MSGVLIAAVLASLAPQAAPHPSAQQPYAEPAVRPFEPGPDFGSALVQGDAPGAMHRRPLTQPVTVDAYAGSYEFAPTDIEAAYEQGVASAEVRTDQTAGPLDGVWRVSDGSGDPALELVMIDSGAGLAEGGWRSGYRSGAAMAADGVLTLEGFGSIVLERDAATWRGQLTQDGRTRPVTLSRPN